MSFRRLKILVVTSNKGFCFYYRAKWPLETLYHMELVDFVAINPEESTPELLGEWTEWADILIFQYTTIPKIIERYSKEIRENKLPKLLVAEFDDDYTNIHPSNISAYRYFGTKEVKLGNNKWLWKDGEVCEAAQGTVFDIKKNKERLESMMRAIGSCDIVTVTNPNLANSYSINPNIEVLPNYINPAAMPEPKQRWLDRNKGRVIIGWQGGDSHHQDLKSIMPALKKIKKFYGDKVHFRFMGACFTGMYDEIDGEFIPWVSPDRFYHVFSRKLYDIGLIPLVDNAFNRCKSNIKWLEYSHYGIASVVSNVSPYKEHIKHKVDGLLFDNNVELYQQLSCLIDDSLFRNKIAGNAKRKVDANFAIKDHAMKWYHLYITSLETKIDVLREG